MKKVSSIFVIFIILFNFTAMEVHAFNSYMPSIEMKGEGAIVVEQNTGKVLFQKNMNEKMYPASTTKIMTTLLALEYGDLEETITVGQEIESIPGDSSKANLYVGQKIVLRELLYGLMLPSGNDAAQTVAVYIAKKIANNPDLSQEEAINQFAKLMTQKAKKLGAKQTHFINPHGYHDEQHYTTPWDMAMITREAMKNEFFREIVKTPNMSYIDTQNSNENNQEKKEWQNTNALIHEQNPNFYPYAVGIKTGRTTEAGRCLISSAVKEDLKVIAVVFKSTEEDIWKDSIQLLSYGIENFQYYTFAQENEVITKAKIKNVHPKDPAEINIVLSKSLKGLLKKDSISKVEKQILPENNDALNDVEQQEGLNLSAPIEKGERVGLVRYLLDGEILAEGELIAETSARKRNFIVAYWWMIIPLLLIFFIIINRKSRSRRRKMKAKRRIK